MKHTTRTFSLDSKSEASRLLSPIRLVKFNTMPIDLGMLEKAVEAHSAVLSIYP
jgi:hypothetical protein